MNRDQFLSELRTGLKGLRAPEIDEIIADYAAHFSEAQAAGRSDADVVQALGNPQRLAIELRVETGLKRWEVRRTPRNFLGAIVGLFGLATIDLFVLLPGICIFGLAVLAATGVLALVGFVGVVLLGTLLFWSHFESTSGPISVFLAGIGMLAGCVGGGALLLLCMEGVLKLLSRYARLHYRFVPTGQATGGGSHG